MADGKEGTLLKKSSDGKLSAPCQGDLCLSLVMGTTPLNGSVEDETFLLKNTFSEGTPLPVINDSFINQLKSGMDDNHLFQIFCTKTSEQKSNTTANDTINSLNTSWTKQTFAKKTSDNSRTNEHKLSSSSLDSTLSTPGNNKVSEIRNTNPFKKPRVKKVKTSFALDTTQDENVSFEEEQQKYKQIERIINPFKKNLKRKKFSVRFNTTFDSSNENIQETDTTPIKEISISTNNDSINNSNKRGVTQNPFRRSNKRKRYSIVGELGASSVSSEEQSETVDIHRSETIYSPHRLQVAKENAKHNPFMKVNLGRFSFNGTLDTSDVASVNESVINENRIENPEIQQLNQPNLLTSEAIQEDLLMKNDENLETKINASIQKCSEFNEESLVSQNDSIKIKERSQEIMNNIENSTKYTITTIAEINSREETITEISTESLQIPSIETSKVNENNSEGILQFVEIERAASQNIDKSELLPNKETVSCALLSTDFNLDNRTETKDGNKIEDFKGNDVAAASNESVLTPDDVILNNILSPSVSNTTRNSVRTEERNSLPPTSEIDNIEEISLKTSERQIEKEHKIESNRRRPSTISEEESAYPSISPNPMKQFHETFCDDVENLSVCIVTTIAEVHSHEEFESESCTAPQDGKVESESNETKENNSEEISHNMEVFTPASQNVGKNELLTKGTESCNSLGSQINLKNKAEPNDANENDEKGIYIEAEAQTGSNGNVLVLPGVGMATTPLNGSVEDQTLLLKNKFSETTLPVINQPFNNQLKTGMDGSYVVPVLCIKQLAQKDNTANNTINSQNSSCTNQTFTKKLSDQSQSKEHELSGSSLNSTLNTSGNNKVREIINTNPFKKIIDKKVINSFTLDTTQEENVPFEEEQQKCKQAESKINPFKKNVKTKKISFRFQKTLDSSNECSQQVTDSRPVKEDSISVNNDSVTDKKKYRISQNPFKRSMKRKRYSIEGKFVTFSASSSDKVDDQCSVTSDAFNVKGVEDNTGIQQLNQSNVSTSMETQEDLIMESYENVEAEINVSVSKSKCSISPISQIDANNCKEVSRENFAICTITTSAEIHSPYESMSEIYTEPTQILSIEAGAFSENSSEEILQFVESGTAVSQNVELEVDAQTASNENVLTSPVERFQGDEVLLNNILPSHISNATTLNSVRGATVERNASLPTNSEICNTGQISPESSKRQIEMILLEKEHKIECNHKKSSNILEEIARPTKHPHATTTITEIHGCKESVSESCTKSENQKVEWGSKKVNNGEEVSQIIILSKPIPQNVDKNELLTKETESCSLLASNLNSEYKAESNDANEEDEKQLHKEAEPQTGSNGNELISPRVVGMATTPLNGSVEDVTLLLKNKFSETSQPVINEPFINQLKSGMDDSYMVPVLFTKPTEQKGNTANDTINSQNSNCTNQTITKKSSDQSQTKEHELSEGSSLNSTLNTSGNNKVREIINTNPFKKIIDKKVINSFTLDTTQEENVPFEEEQQKCKQVESKINPFKKNLKRKKISFRFQKTFDSSNKSGQETDSRPVKEDSISVNNDNVTGENKDRLSEIPSKMSNQSEIMSKVGNSSAGSYIQSETLGIQRSVISDPFSVNDSNVNVKVIEDNNEIQQLYQSNLEDLLMESDEYIELEILTNAEKCSEFNESLVSQNDSIKTNKEVSQENLAACTISTIAAEIHTLDEPMTEISTQSTQFLSIEADEFSESNSAKILQFEESGTAAAQNPHKSELLSNKEPQSCTSLNSAINLENLAETEDTGAGDEAENSKEDDDAQAASNETAFTLPGERCPRDQAFPVSNTTLYSVPVVSDERNNLEIHKTGHISPESSDAQVEKALLEKEHKIESSNHKKPLNISKKESDLPSKLLHATPSDDVENLSVCRITTIAEVHSYKEFESESCKEFTEGQKIDCGNNETTENNGEEITQIIIVSKPTSQNVDKNDLSTKETESFGLLPSSENSENMAEPNDANERKEKPMRKEPETQMETSGNIPISPGKQSVDNEANNIVLGNNLLSSHSDAIIACTSQLSEKKEIPKSVEEKSKTGTHTMSSIICETKNTPPPRNVEHNGELAVEQSRVCTQTGNGEFSDECDLNKDSGKRLLVRRKSSRIARLSVNKSYEDINISKNTSTKHNKARKILKGSNISATLTECISKRDVEKEMNVGINIASNEVSAINLNCKSDKKNVETNVSNEIHHEIASRNEVSKITRQNECLKENVTSQLINDKYNRDPGCSHNQAGDSNKQQLSDCGKTRTKKSLNFSSKSNTENNNKKGVAISMRQTPLKDINKIIRESSKNSSKEKEKPVDSFTVKGNNEHFEELSLSFDISAIPNNKLISGRKRKCKSTPIVQRSSRSKRLSVNVLLPDENRKNTIGLDNLSTVSASKHSKEPKKILKEKTLNSANDFAFAAPKIVSRKSSITGVKTRRSVTFRPHTSLIPPPDDTVNTKISTRGNNGSKVSTIDMQKSLGKKSKNSMERNSCKIVSTDVSSKYNNKKIERNSVVDNKTNKDISYETTLEVSEIAHHTPTQKKRLLFHSTPKNRITSLGTPCLARKRIQPSGNQVTPPPSSSASSSASSLYSTTGTDAIQSGSYTPTRTLRNSFSNTSSNTNVLSYNSHTRIAATKITAISAHQSNQDNALYSAQNITKTTSNGAVEPSNSSDVLVEESSCFNRPPDDSFSTSYSIGGVNESINARPVLEESAIIVETEERSSLKNGTMHMTLRSSRTTLQHSNVYSKTQLSEFTQTTFNESNLVVEKSLPLISKFSKYKKKRRDTIFGIVEKKKVVPHNEPLPKLAKPAKWIKKELYTFLEKKLGTKYKLEKRYHCERLVLILHNAVTNALMGHPELSLLTLKKELINYGICKSQLDYFTFLHRYTPLAFIKKNIPLGRAYDNGDFKYKQIVAYGILE